jgi:hypothetical protein
MGSATIDRDLTSASDNQTSAAIVSAGQVLWPRRSGWQTFTHNWGTTSPTSPVTHHDVPIELDGKGQTATTHGVISHGTRPLGHYWTKRQEVVLPSCTGLPRFFQCYANSNCMGMALYSLSLLWSVSDYRCEPISSFHLLLSQTGLECRALQYSMIEHTIISVCVSDMCLEQ